MNMLLKKKSPVSFLFAAIAVLTAVTAMIYILFSSAYGIRNTAVILSSAAAFVLAAILFTVDSPADSLLEILLSICLGLALALFVVSCVGDYADAVAKIVMFGSGASIKGIVAIDILMFISLLLSFISAGFRKGEAEQITAEEKAAMASANNGKKLAIAAVVIVCIAFAAFLAGRRLIGGNRFAIEKTPSEHGSYSFEMKDKEVKKAASGDIVTVKVAPEEGFIFNSINVKGSSDEVVTFKSGNDQYSFTMPSEKVSVSVLFGYKPTEYSPDDSVKAQTGFSKAGLLTYADSTFEYTYVTTGQEYGATQTKTSYYTGTWEMDGDTIVLTVGERDDTYSFTHPRTEAAKGAYDQFCEEHGSEITDRLDAANTAYINTPDLNETLSFTLDNTAMNFGIK